MGGIPYPDCFQCPNEAVDVLFQVLTPEERCVAIATIRLRLGWPYTKRFTAQQVARVANVSLESTFNALEKLAQMDYIGACGTSPEGEGLFEVRIG